MNRDYSEYQPSGYELYRYWHGNGREVRFDYFDNRVSFDPDSRSIRIQVDPRNEEIFLREAIEADVAFQEERLGIRFRAEDDADCEEDREEALRENQEDYDRLCARYEIDRGHFENDLRNWYGFHPEEKMIPLNNVLSGSVVRLQYGEGLLDFIYADFLPAYRESLEQFLLFREAVGDVAEERLHEEERSEEKTDPDAGKVFNRTQEIVTDYFKYASTCFYTRAISNRSLYSAICPPLFERDSAADKGLRRYCRYLTMLQKEYLELLEFCFDETYYPEVLGELHPAERYRLYRRLHDQPQLSRRDELFSFSSRMMGERGMPYGMPVEEVLSRVGRSRKPTERHTAFAEKYGVPVDELSGMIAFPRFLHVEYAFHSVADILDLEFTKLLEHPVRFRKCGRCGRYFILKGKYDTRYCGRAVEGTSRTCREVAAQENYQRKHEGDSAIHIYSKYYKRYSARVRVNQIRAEDFKRWKYQAIAKRDECSGGRISVGEYIDWLESSFPNRTRKQE